MNQLPNRRKLYLIGMMGSGKSHWAGRLGQHLGVPNFDLDKLIESAAGKTVKDIFEQEGEDAFRLMESNLLRTAVPDTGFVLACGGGTPCFYNNMEFMKQTGIVIWLNPAIDELVRRISWAPGTRPILAYAKTEAEQKSHLENLLEKRVEWYSKADLIIDENVPKANKFFQVVTDLLSEQA